MVTPDSHPVLPYRLSVSAAGAAGLKRASRPLHPSPPPPRPRSPYNAPPAAFPHRGQAGGQPPEGPPCPWLRWRTLPQGASAGGCASSNSRLERAGDRSPPGSADPPGVRGPPPGSVCVGAGGAGGGVRGSSRGFPPAPSQLPAIG